MSSALHLIKPFDKGTNCWNVFIETPKGSNLKYALDEKTGLLIVKKALPEGMVFPFNFGMIPGTLADDGDPVDVLVFKEVPLIAGCLLQVRPVGVIEAEQSEGKKVVRNDRILGQAVPKDVPTELEEITLTGKMVSQIEFFFKAYNKAYGGQIQGLGSRKCKKSHRTPKPGRKKGPQEIKLNSERKTMPQGDKSSYTSKQKRQAEHIEKSYRSKGVSAKTAKKRAWATTNKQSGGGKKSGGGRKGK